MWEDKANANGGQWRIQLANRKELLDEYWINTLMTVIGEGFCPADSDDIAGIVFNVRRNGDRLSIWTKSAVNEQLQMSIGMRWKDTVIGRSTLEYLTFKDQKSSSSRSTKSRYTIE